MFILSTIPINNKEEQTKLGENADGFAIKLPLDPRNKLVGECTDF